jgi:hypothetical protein
MSEILEYKRPGMNIAIWKRLHPASCRGIFIPGGIVA